MNKIELTDAECKAYIINRFNKIKAALEANPTAYVVWCGSHIGRPKIDPEKMLVTLEKKHRAGKLTKLNFSSKTHLQDNVHDVAAMIVEMRLV